MVLVTLALAAAPGTALAQSGAGDEQYQDPFAGQQSGGTKSSGSSLSSKPPTATPSPQAAPAAAPVPTPAPSSQQLPSELARTGFDLRLLAALGAALLGGGLLLRRRADVR